MPEGRVARLTPAQVEDFHEKGVIVLGQIMTHDELEEGRAEFERIFREQEQAMGVNMRNLNARSWDIEDQKEATPERMLQIINMFNFGDYFARLLHREDLLDAIEAVMTPSIQLFHDQSFYKPAKHGGVVTFHQDNGYWRCKPEIMTSIWMTFDDATEENGCLWMEMGSHKEGMIPHKQTDDMPLLHVPVDGRNLKPFRIPAGHALMHHCLTVHGSYANKSERPRRAHAIHYMPVGTKNGEGQAMEADDAHPILRQRPMAGAR